MQYDFNVRIKELDGTDVKVRDSKGEEIYPIMYRTLGTLLAEFIGSETKGHTLKLYGWMKKLQVSDPLELDDADKKTLSDLIENSDRININCKGQIFDILK